MVCHLAEDAFRFAANVSLAWRRRRCCHFRREYQKRDWKHKMRCWWCDALYRTYLWTFWKFRACFIRDFFIHYPSLFLVVWLLDSFYISLFSRFYSFHSTVLSQSLRNNSQRCKFITVEAHISFSWWIFYTGHRDHVARFMGNLFITPDFWVMAHLTHTLQSLWCIVKDFEQISFGDEIEYRLFVNRILKVHDVTHKYNEVRTRHLRQVSEVNS